MFYAPFGCKWRHTKSWNFKVDRQLARVSNTDRDKRDVSLDIVKSQFEKNPFIYNVSDKWSGDFKVCALNTITRDCGPTCLNPIVNMKTTVPA
jgi:hypothetical protein